MNPTISRAFLKSPCKSSGSSDSSGMGNQLMGTRPLERDVLDIGHRLLLAAYGPHLLFTVALAGGRSARHGLLDACEIVLGERYACGASVLFQVLAALGPWDGDDIVTLSEEPRE